MQGEKPYNDLNMPTLQTLKISSLKKVGTYKSGRLMGGSLSVIKYGTRKSV